MMVVKLSMQFPSFCSQPSSEGGGAGTDVRRRTEVAGGPWRLPAKIGDQGTLPRYSR